MSNPRPTHADSRVRFHEEYGCIDQFGISGRFWAGALEVTHDRRVQMQRTLGWRKPEDVVVITRNTKWGNPHRCDKKPCDVPACNGVKHTCEEALDLYREYLAGSPDLLAEARVRFHSKRVGCTCPVTVPCHGDILLAAVRTAWWPGPPPND